MIKMEICALITWENVFLNTWMKQPLNPPLLIYIQLFTKRMLIFVMKRNDFVTREIINYLNDMRGYDHIWIAVWIFGDGVILLKDIGEVWPWRRGMAILSSLWSAVNSRWSDCPIVTAEWNFIRPMLTTAKSPWRKKWISRSGAWSPVPSNRSGSCHEQRRFLCTCTVSLTAIRFSRPARSCFDRTSGTRRSSFSRIMMALAIITHCKESVRCIDDTRQYRPCQPVYVWFSVSSLTFCRSASAKTSSPFWA